MIHSIKAIVAYALLASSILHADISGLVPLPQEVKKTGVEFELPKTYKVKFSSDFKGEAGLFQEELSRYLPDFSLDQESPFTLMLKKVKGMDDEEYRLKTYKKGIVVEASHGAGAYFGAQTVIQILQAAETLPEVSISDKPRFGWRGLMLDSSRHFQTTDEIKRFIDNLAHHKFNVFHWHLTDMPGWRMESKKYPKLTTVGAWRMQRNYPEKGMTSKYGGFYTQEEIKEIVKYAAARHVTILPEVDFPGHGDAAIASYSILGCSQKPQTVYSKQDYPPKDTKWLPEEIAKQSELCVSRETSIRFSKDIIDEVMELFPSKYIHIGGDEAEKHAWSKCKSCQAKIKEEGLKNEHELQSWYIKQLDEHINSKGRIMVGWDEILEGGLAKNATVMSWTGTRGGIRSAKMGHEVIMTPISHLYLNMKQSHSPLEPPNIGGFIDLKKVYSFEAYQPELSAKENALIKGLEGNLWTEFIHEEWKLELSTWPRACAVAEIAWLDKDKKDFADFENRLQNHRKQLDSMNINYWWEDSVELATWTPATMEEGKFTRAIDVSSQLQGIQPGKFMVSFQYKSGAHALLIKEVELWVNGKSVSVDKHQGSAGSEHKDNSYTLELPEVSSSDKIELKCTLEGSGGTDSNGVIQIIQNNTIVKEDW